MLCGAIIPNYRQSGGGVEVFFSTHHQLPRAHREPPNGATLLIPRLDSGAVRLSSALTLERRSACACHRETYALIQILAAFLIILASDFRGALQISEHIR